jgi:hypothetical protein
MSDAVSRDIIEGLMATQKTNGDLASAVDKYYAAKDDNDMPALFQEPDNTRWDNTAFAAGRYGEDSNSGGIPSRSFVPLHFNGQARLTRETTSIRY